MDQHQRSRLAFGLVLTVVGAVLLLLQVFPGLHMFGIWFSWPSIVIAVGLLLMLVGLATVQPDMLEPGMVVAGIGGILFYQNTTGDWQSWAYMWTLIEGFIGLGQMLAGAAGSSRPNLVRHGIREIITSIILFLIFASIFRPMFGQTTWLGIYWPLLLVVAGILLILQGVIRTKK